MRIIIFQNMFYPKKSMVNFIKVSICFTSLLLVLSSCKTVIEEYPDKNYIKVKSNTLYNIEFVKKVENQGNKGEFLSSIMTNYIPVVYDSCHKPILAFYDVKMNIYRIDSINTKVITTMANGINTPSVIEPIRGQTDCFSCSRDRSGLIWEIKAMGGIRRNPLKWNAIDQTVYPDTTYIQDDFGFGYGGSKILVGGEISAITGFKFLDKLFYWLDKTPSSTKIGILTGLWPMDGSYFVPAAIRLRYTSNVNAFVDCCSAMRSCNTWFFFTDFGGLITIKKDKDKNIKPLGAFADLGLGKEFAITKHIDLSVDLGYRWIYTPLPELIAPPECVQNQDLNPYRLSNAVFLRLGLSF
ncbi:MAG: hypothetical protein WCR42_09550 [bacterium]